MPNITAISMDPSSTQTGYSIYQQRDCSIELIDFGSIKPPAKLPAVERVESMVIDLGVLISKHKPAQGFIECLGKATYQRGGKSGNAGEHVLRKAWAVLYALLVEQLGLYNIYGVTPQTWKGNRPKEYTLDIVNKTYSLELIPKENDIADAIYLGGWFLERQKIDPIQPILRCNL